MLTLIRQPASITGNLPRPSRVATRLPVLCGAALAIVAFFCAALPVTAQEVRSLAHPALTAGVMDLRGVDLAKAGPIGLSGPWQFFWKQLVPPGLFSGQAGQTSSLEEHGFAVTSLSKLPQPWTNVTVDGKRLPPTGYATYHLRVLLAHPYPFMSLLLSGIRTSFVCYVNGVKVAQSGVVGTSRSAEVPSQVLRTPEFEVRSGRLDIVLQVANYYHNRPGVTSFVKLGVGRTIEYGQQRSASFDFLLVGAFLIMGLYQIGLFALRREDRSLLLFGIFCLLMVVRLYTDTDRPWELVSAVPWEILLKLEYLTFSLGFPVFVLFAWTLYRRHFHRIVRDVLLGLSGLYSAIIIATPNLFYGKLLIAFQFLVLLTAVYFLWVLVRALSHRRADTLVFLGGYLVIVAGVANDILVDEGILHTPYLFPYALFIFVLVQAAQLALRFARVYRRVEHLSRLRARLSTANQSLRQLSYVDSLTGTANRRYFDHFIREEWARGIRYSSPLALLMIDIDAFKPFNDNYGHQAGDETLRRVADALGSGVRRSVDFLARYGGEEFVVILPNTTLEGAATVAATLLAAVEELSIPHEFSQAEKVVTISIGAACLVPKAKQSWDELVDVADRALYRAKQEGRNRVATSAFP